MEKLILTDPLINPNDDTLEATLGNKYKIFKEFVNKITELNLVMEWNYYKDQKSWLCKIIYKKKNQCWLSIWNTGFKLTFYFTEKTINGVHELNINNEIKTEAKEIKPVGKFRPIIVLIENNKKMNDALKILKYKMELK